MPFCLVLTDNAAFDLSRLILIVEAEEDEAEAAPSLSHLLPHDDGVLDLAELLEVVLQVLLRRGESQTANEQFHLVLLGWLVEGSCGSVATTTALVAARHAAAAAHTTRELVLERRHERCHHREVVLGQASHHLHLLEVEQVEVGVATDVAAARHPLVHRGGRSASSSIEVVQALQLLLLLENLVEHRVQASRRLLIQI